MRVNNRTISLAGLTIRLNLPAGAVIPSPWNFFETSSSADPQISFYYHAEACPLSPEGDPLNDALYFHMFPLKGQPGFIGVPHEGGWSFIYRRSPLQIDVYDPPGSKAPSVGELAASALWRFRGFYLSAFDRFCFHAMAAMKNDRSYIFAGDSGRGKSTLGRILNKEGWTVLSDESPIVEALPDGGFKVWGSPWPSSGGFFSDASGELKAIFHLAHGADNEINPLSPGEMAKCLIGPRLLTCPWYDQATRDRLLPHFDRLIRSTPGGLLKFRPEREVAAVIEEF